MRSARTRFVLTVIAVLVLAAGLRALPPATARRAPVTPVPGQALPLTAAQAVAMARATKSPVVASSLTTPDSLTTANPDGMLTLTQTLEPTRAWQPGPDGTGQWVPVSANLVRARGRLATTATTQPLTVSAGGAGPLAVLSDAGRTLALNWPGTLPTPVVSGATATYPSVLPGVDLVVTADTMGDLDTTLIIHDATAAANPALRSLKVTLSPTPGLRVTADAMGNLAIGAGGNAQPAFTADAPLMWDSAPSPAGTPIDTGSSADPARVAQSGLPASSSVAAPGIGAHITRVPLSVSGDTITLAPPAAALTGPAVVYPVFIDPNLKTVGDNAWNWAQVDDAYPDQAFWKPSSDLQLGYCYPSAACAALKVERDFFTVPISSTLNHSNVVIYHSHIEMNDEWVANCNLADDQVNLYKTPLISSSNEPTWNSTNNSTTWNDEIAHQSFAFQNPSLPGATGQCNWDGANTPDVSWDVTNTVKADVGHVSAQTFGLRANNESNNGVDTNWHQFQSGADKFIISTQYNLNPAQPSSLGATGGTVPAVACGTSTSPVQIGHDDLTLSAYQADSDGDTMTTKITIVAPTSPSVDLLGTPLPLGPTQSQSGTVSTVISRTTLTNLHATAFTYEWWATTTDENYTTTAGAISTKAETSNPCYFRYDPNGPGQPIIQSWAFPPNTPACPDASPCPTSPTTPVAIGQKLTVTVGPPTGCNSTDSPCPTSYTYQLGAGQPATVTVSSTGSCTASACAMTFTMNQLGPVTLTVAGMANGNPGTAITPGLTGVTPSPAYKDGYFSGGANPDLLAVGSGKRPSLWLYPGTGLDGIGIGIHILGSGIDIGSEGTGINPGTDGPADWSTGTNSTVQVAHGDFTRDGVQDVIAYYPPGNPTAGAHAGFGILIPGPGIDATLQAQSAPLTQIEPSQWTDAMFNGSAGTPLPISLVGAGNASESSSTTNPTGGDDLVGVYGDPNDGYELAMWTAGFQTGAYGDAFNGFGAGEMIPLSPQGTLGPDGSTWNKFSLATAQPGGEASATVLFALDTSNGQLWMSANTGCTPTNPTATCSTANPGGLIGTSGTWHRLTVPSGITLTGTSLASADVNHSGTTELWDVSNGTATAYTVDYTNDTIAQEAPWVALTSPAASWPLTDGSAVGCPSTTPAIATDEINGLTASLTGGASWACDDTFDTVLELDGNTGQAQTSGPLLNTSQSYTVAAWVRLTSTAHISVAVSQDGTNTSEFRLQFQQRSNTWQFIVANTDSQTPSLSYAIGTAPGTAPTLDAWTFLVGVYDAGSKTATLYVNGILAGSTSVGSTINDGGPFRMGRGMYNSGSSGVPAQIYYWAGDLAQVQAWSSALTQAQVQALYQPAR